MFGFGFDTLFAPSTQCKGCNMKMKLTGDFFPKEGYCSNCGKPFNLSFDGYKFPNVKFDEKGDLIKDENNNPVKNEVK